MPTVTFLGPFVSRRRPDNAESWLRSQPTEVSQAWLNQWRSKVNQPKYFLVEGDQGDEGETVDFDDDNIPDSGWTKKDITNWIVENGGKVDGYSTKSKLLVTVDNIRNPALGEETISEDTLAQSVGVEE